MAWELTMWTLLIGCAPGVFTAEEAAVVFEAVSSVNADTYASIHAASGVGDLEGTGFSKGTAKGVSWHTGAEGGSFEGTVEGPGSWTGVVEVVGDYTIELVDRESWVAVWSLDATYVDLAYGDLALAGDARWNIRAETEGSSFLHTSTVAGDIAATGQVAGAGALDYATTVSLAAGRYQVFTEGTVGGHDIGTAYDATAFGL